MDGKPTEKGPLASCLDPRKVMPVGITFMAAIFVALLLLTLKAPSQQATPEEQINAQNRATLRNMSSQTGTSGTNSGAPPLSHNLVRPTAGRPAWVPFWGRELAKGLGLGSGAGNSTGAVSPWPLPPVHNCDIQDTMARGFRWMANQQRADGSWPEEAGDKGVAVTGLAMLAFYMNDYTHVGSMYNKEMKKALDFMLKAVAVNKGDFWKHGSHAGYVQGIATYAVAEAYRRTGDKKLLKPTQQCLKALLAGAKVTVNKTTKTREFSWGYRFKQGGDMSVNGWCVQGMMNANYSPGISVSASDINAAYNGLDIWHSWVGTAPNLTPTGEYGYKGGQTKARDWRTLSAAGMVSYELLHTLDANMDWHKKNKKKGTFPIDPQLEASKNFLMNRLLIPPIYTGPRTGQVGGNLWHEYHGNRFRGYYAYYATIAMKVYGGIYTGIEWDIWRAWTGFFLCHEQVKVGADEGYWHKGGEDSIHCTQAWCLLALAAAEYAYPQGGEGPQRGPIPSEFNIEVPAP